MKILDKYILKKFLSAFFFVVLIIVSIIVVIDITEKTEKFIKAELTFIEIFSFYMDYIPWIANTIAPHHHIYCGCIRDIQVGKSY